MLAAVKGYYDGKQIVIDESDQKSFHIGDEVIITILDNTIAQKLETRVEKRKKIVVSDEYVKSTKRTKKEIEGYMKEMRSDDRL